MGKTINTSRNDFTADPGYPSYTDRDNEKYSRYSQMRKGGKTRIAIMSAIIIAFFVVLGILYFNL
ncbi:MAG: hypothetical protein CME62_12545 [Halobacteriovoraceae bacterium]|nr:hypothetical protein [Halobacteriovoraceae bacterium]|tara:strand:- start:4787 stop:4981 length:195 start_codon:yes stop_codon:yes gene_type:complete